MRRAKTITLTETCVEMLRTLVEVWGSPSESAVVERCIRGQFLVDPLVKARAECGSNQQYFDALPKSVSTQKPEDSPKQ